MRRSLLLAAALAASAAANAQIVSIYGTFSPTHVSNVETGVILANATYTEQYTSFWASGVGGGVTFGVLPIGPVHIGLDLRGSTRPGTNGVDTGLLGVRVQLKLPLVRFKPYAELAGGYVGTRSVNVTAQLTGQTFANNYAAFEGIAGVDYKLGPFFDFRIIELGTGKGYNGGLNFGAGTASNDLTFITVNTGIVFHF